MVQHVHVATLTLKFKVCRRGPIVLNVTLASIGQIKTFS